MAEQMTMEQMGRLDDHHKRLREFEGRYRATVKVYMGPGEPMVSTGVMTNTLDLDGRFLRQEYQGDPAPGPFPNFEGRGFWGYNTVDRRWEGMWIDTMTTMMQVEHGQVDAAGRVWDMSSEMTDPSTGGIIRKRSVITLKDRDHHSLEMYFAAPDGGGEHKSMEIQYERLP